MFDGMSQQEFVIVGLVVLAVAWAVAILPALLVNPW